MIERWQVAVRDHPDRPPPMQCHVLTMLSLRVNWRTGRGFASTQMLMDDAGAGESTVWRATKWARQAELLLQTRRGHRISAEVVTASEWLLTQPVTGDRLDQSQPVNGSDPTCQSGRPNLSAQMHHQESSTSSTSTSALSAGLPGQRAKRRAHARGTADASLAAPRAGPTAFIVAPPCPVCGRPFSQEWLADPETRAQAMAGEICHSECIGKDAEDYERQQAVYRKCPACGQEVALYPGGGGRMRVHGPRDKPCRGSRKHPERVTP